VTINPANMSQNKTTFALAEIETGTNRVIRGAFTQLPPLKLVVDYSLLTENRILTPQEIVELEQFALIRYV
jgi:hypothetical protein